MINKSLYPSKINIGLKKVSNNGVVAYVAEGMSAFSRVRHFFSTRVGGVSTGDYESLNLSWRRDDSMENIVENFSIAASAMGFDEQDMVLAEQTHSANVAYVVETNKNMMRMNEYLIGDTDALITDKKHVVLTARTADCVPVLMYDPKGAIAAVHSGWKGTVNNIIGNTVAEMISRFGSKPEDIIAVVGPSIGPCCFEVQEDVRTHFASAGYEDCIYLSEGSIHIDLWSCCVAQLIKSGLKEENITLGGNCTCCEKDMFFSHRRERGNTGGMTAFIELI